MPDLLISGPAGADKSARARLELRKLGESGEPAIAVDFQALYAALTLASRDADGNYPLRDTRLLPITEYVRRAAITGARQSGIAIVATNSDGSGLRRDVLLDSLGNDAREIVVDPGEDVVVRRLSNPRTRKLSGQCRTAINRWYRPANRTFGGRKPRR